ncbi:class I SAM-dependent methyltransferase family protein [Kosakonia sp. H02]|nr:class I SAM-dependent methyltransferase family protein [Kosakonia sp. H02]
MPQTDQMHHFVSHDSQQITYRYFPARSQNGPSHAIILFYRERDFCEDVVAFVGTLGLADCAVFVIDFDSNDIMPGTADGSSAISHEGYYFQQFIDHITTHYSIRAQDIALISHGDRAVVIAAWMTDYALDIRSVVFYSPKFFFRKRDALLYRLKGVAKRQLPPYPAINDLLYSSQRVFRSAFAWSTPTQFVLTKDDRKTRLAPLMTFYANLGSRIKALLMMPDTGFGCPEQEWNTEKMAQTRSFLAAHFLQTTPAPSLFDSHLRGATQDEYEKLRLPEQNVFKRLYWMLAAFALRRVGKLSTGVQLGLETGFDSGASLEYVYENQPSGKNALGTTLDRYYLNNIGWHCTRMREKHVEELISLAATRLAEQEQTVRILDVAAGHGRYVLNAIEKIQQPITHILMRDFELSNVQEGEKLLMQRGLMDIARFEQGDAFSPDDLATLPGDRTLSVVSGFYELFSDNNLVLTSLNGIANATKKGGYLVYTTKFWNPKLALMARVLPSHKKGEHWLLRRRTQREIDQLVKRAGFAKITQRVDPWGMFSVTLAKKVR